MAIRKVVPRIDVVARAHDRGIGHPLRAVIVHVAVGAPFDLVLIDSGMRMGHCVSVAFRADFPDAPQHFDLFRGFNITHGVDGRR